MGSDKGDMILVPTRPSQLVATALLHCYLVRSPFHGTHLAPISAPSLRLLTQASSLVRWQSFDGTQAQPTFADLLFCPPTCLRPCGKELGIRASHVALEEPYYRLALSQLAPELQLSREPSPEDGSINRLVVDVRFHRHHHGQRRDWPRRRSTLTDAAATR